MEEEWYNRKPSKLRWLEGKSCFLNSNNQTKISFNKIKNSTEQN